MPQARGVLSGEVRQAGVAGSVCADLDGGQVRAEPVNGRGGMGVGVGIDADDDISQFCEHGHGPFSRRARAVRPVRHRPGGTHPAAHL